MHTWTLKARDVAGARSYLLWILRDPEYKVIYFDGWGGFGASAVLRYLAQFPPSDEEGCSFDRIIYIDGSYLTSRRAMQRVIAEQLELSSETMALFDEQDMEDDFNRVDQCSRDVIQNVGEAIYNTLRGCRFMVIFVNGSKDEVVDLTSFGISFFTRYDKNLMIWTFGRRFLTLNRQDKDFEDILQGSHLLLKYIREDIELSSTEFCALLREEAITIIYHNPSMRGIDITMVTDCCLYELFLHYNFHTATKFGWAAHASNYWMCDGIIQERNTVKDINSALQREISWQFKADSFLGTILRSLMKYLNPPFLVVKDDEVYQDGPYRWISITSKNITQVCGMQSIPVETSSFFLAFKTTDNSPKPKALLADLFRHSSILGVLVLCYCGFDFASPPFLVCHSLKFLGLDHCVCTNENMCEKGKHEDWAALYSLHVLDLRYTEWDEIMSQGNMALMCNLEELNIVGFRCWQHYRRQLQGWLPRLHKLRVLKPTQQITEISTDTDNSLVSKTHLEIIDLSGNNIMEIIPNNISQVSSLLVLVLDGCN